MDVLKQNEGYKILARALKDYFTPHPYESLILLALLLPALIALIWLIATMYPRTQRKGQITSVKPSKRDIEFFEVARLQKGLETFDRDLLIEVAERYNIHPIYRLLLDRQVFEKALKRAEEEQSRKVRGALDKKTLDYLKHLHTRLFNSK